MTPEQAAEKLTKEQLQEAIAIKEREEAPLVQAYINPQAFITFAKAEVESMLDGTYSEQASADTNNEAYEIIMKAVYGEDIFDWMNSKGH